MDIKKNSRFNINNFEGIFPIIYSFFNKNNSLDTKAIIEEMLNGMNIIDRHVLEVTRNIPMLLGLIDVWNNSIIGTNSLAIVPYSYRLRYFPSHLQQLMMESLGKSVSSEGESLKTKSGVAVFGASGTDAQHSFFQMLHQGTETIPVDLIGFARLSNGTSQELIANLIAQAETLAFGQDTDERREKTEWHSVAIFSEPLVRIAEQYLRKGSKI